MTAASARPVRGQDRRRPDAGPDWDAVVVGARVAGAATALLLARAGLRVLVVDRARRGSDTLSTHALMRGGVLQLRRWGVLERVVAAGAPPVRRVTFHYGSQATPVALKPHAGVSALYAPRRTVLDAALADAAEAAGARLRFGLVVTDLAATTPAASPGWCYATTTGPPGPSAPGSWSAPTGAAGLGAGRGRGCWKDPLSTHGITAALHDAELLATAVVAGAASQRTTGIALAGYQAQRDRGPGRCTRSSTASPPTSGTSPRPASCCRRLHR